MSAAAAAPEIWETTYNNVLKRLVDAETQTGTSVNRDVKDLITIINNLGSEFRQKITQAEKDNGDLKREITNMSVIFRNNAREILGLKKNTGKSGNKPFLESNVPSEHFVSFCNKFIFKQTICFSSLNVNQN